MMDKEKNEMNLKTTIMVLTIISSAIIMGLSTDAIAETKENESIIITPINADISLQKTITTMIIPEDNILPWGSVKGKASDYVERYPVIIQFFKGEEAVHFAQVDVKGDGSYEYKFRVRNVDTQTGQAVNIFEGEYTVKIFKVINNQNNAI